MTDPEALDRLHQATDLELLGAKLLVAVMWRYSGPRHPYAMSLRLFRRPGQDTDIILFTSSGLFTLELSHLIFSCRDPVGNRQIGGLFFHGWLRWPSDMSCIFSQSVDAYEYFIGNILTI